MTSPKKLTEMQQKFLDVLFDEAGGDAVVAKKLAGYSDTTATTVIIESLRDEIAAATQNYIARNAPAAAVAMVGVIKDPSQLGIKEQMAASKDIMDRAGFAKVEKVEVTAKGGVMLLPPKD